MSASQLQLQRKELHQLICLIFADRVKFEEYTTPAAIPDHTLMGRQLYILRRMGYKGKDLWPIEFREAHGDKKFFD